MIKSTIKTLKKLLLAGALLTAGISTAIAQPMILSPMEIIEETIQEFTWTSNETIVTEWWLYVGDDNDDNAYFNSGSLGDNTSVVVTGLPLDAGFLVATLWYREEGVDGWQTVYAGYELEGGDVGEPEIVYPSADGEFFGDLEWNANHAPVQQWWVNLGVVPAGIG